MNEVDRIIELHARVFAKNQYDSLAALSNFVCSVQMRLPRAFITSIDYAFR